MSLLIPANDSKNDGGCIVVSSTPVVSAAAIYASGDSIGGLITLSNVAPQTNVNNAGSGKINSAVIADKAAQSANIDVVFFDSNPSATTVTDNVALTIADADLTKIIGVIALTTHKTFVNNSVSVAQDQSIPFNLGNASTLYAILVARSTPTFVATTDVTLRVGITPT